MTHPWQASADLERLGRFGTWCWNPQTEWLDASRQALDLFGSGSLEAGVCLADHAGIPGWIEFAAALRDSAVSGTLIDIDLCLPVDGASQWRNVRGERWLSPTGPCVRGIVQDIHGRKCHELDLQEADTVTSQLLDALPAGAGIIDRNLRFVHVNAALAQINGIPAANHIGQAVADLLPDLLPAAQSLAEAVLATGEPVRNRHVSGETPSSPGCVREWVESWHPIRLDGGTVSGFAVLVEEVSALRRTEEELQRRNHHLRAVLASIDSGFQIVDQDYRIVEINPAGREIYLGRGVDPDALLGMSVAEVFFKDEPDSPFLKNLHISMRERIPTEVEARFEQWDRWFNVRHFPTPDGGIATLFFDITERKRSETLLLNALAEAERGQYLLRALMDHVPVGVVIADADLHIYLTSESARRISGKHDAILCSGPTEIARCWEIHHQDGTPASDEDLPLVRAIRTGEASLDEVWLIKDASGRNIPITCSAAPIRDANGTITGGVATFSDISEQCDLQESLRQANRRKNDFIAVLSHELRNPLSPISTGVEVLKSTCSSPQASMVLNILERQVAQLARLLDDLLDVSRINCGKMELRCEFAELGGIIKGAIEAADSAIHAKEHQLVLNLPAIPIWLYADPARLTQVFLNLLNNAAKYMERGGTIQLNVVERPGEVTISIKDDGIGIPADSIEAIFDMFSQVGGSSAGGLGIGLALAKLLVELHGGSIAVRSEGPRRGSEFMVTLKTINEAPGSQAAQATPATGPRRILVVDDNQDCTTTTAALLESHGHTVQTAATGRAGLAIARRFKPSVVILDVGLPDISGHQVCRSLRQLPEGHQLTIIAMTGWGQPEDRRLTTEAGFDAHLVKPVPPADLLDVLAQLSPAS